MAGESGATARSRRSCPRASALNYVFQRHVLRSLPASESVFRRKFARALQHLRAYDEHGPGTPPAEACLLRVRRRLGSRDPALLRRARGRAPGARGHPPERARRARERLARGLLAALGRARSRGRPGATAARRADRLAGGARGALRDHATSRPATRAPPAFRRSRSTSSRAPIPASTYPRPTWPRSSARACACFARKARSAAGSTCRTTTRTSTRASRATTSCASRTAPGVS